MARRLNLILLAVLIAVHLHLTVSGSWSGQAMNNPRTQFEDRRIKPMDLTITMLYNNVPQNERLTTAWGMSCLIEGLKKNILFDTGGDGHILLSNMKKLGKEPGLIDIVVLSHPHGDHTGGLGAFLGSGARVELFLPKSFPESFKSQARALGCKVISVDGPTEIMKGVYSTGEMGTGIKEQALILETSEGLNVITGCAHPGVVNMVKRAKEISALEVNLVMGGFHLMELSEAQVAEVIKELKVLGVRKVGPSHCTGDRAISMFRQEWPDDFIELGCGGIIRLDLPARERLDR